MTAFPGGLLGLGHSHPALHLSGMARTGPGIAPKRGATAASTGAVLGVDHDQLGAQHGDDLAVQGHDLAAISDDMGFKTGGMQVFMDDTFLDGAVKEAEIRVVTDDYFGAVAANIAPGGGGGLGGTCRAHKDQYTGPDELVNSS